MRKLLTTLVATAIITGFLCGCASLSTSTYKTLEASRIVVQNATLAWGDYVRYRDATGDPVPKAQIDKGREIFNRWKAASLSAGRALEGYLRAKESGNSEAIASAEALLRTAIGVLSSVQTEYVTQTTQAP